MLIIVDAHVWSRICSKYMYGNFPEVTKLENIWVSKRENAVGKAIYDWCTL